MKEMPTAVLPADSEYIYQPDSDSWIVQKKSANKKLSKKHQEEQICPSCGEWKTSDFTTEQLKDMDWECSECANKRLVAPEELPENRGQKEISTFDPEYEWLIKLVNVVTGAGVPASEIKNLSQSHPFKTIDDAGDLAAQIWTLATEKYHIPREWLAKRLPKKSDKQASSNTFLVDPDGETTVRAYKNPSIEQVKNLLGAAAKKELRFLVTADSSIYIWDSYYMTHEQFVCSMGIEEQTHSEGYINTVEDYNELLHEYKRTNLKRAYEGGWPTEEDSVSWGAAAPNTYSDEATINHDYPMGLREGDDGKPIVICPKCKSDKIDKESSPAKCQDCGTDFVPKPDRGSDDPSVNDYSQNYFWGPNDLGRSHQNQPGANGWLPAGSEDMDGPSPNSRMSSLKVKATLDHAYWIDPNGKAFQVRGKDFGATYSGKDTHDGWIRNNLLMLKHDYGIEPRKSQWGAHLSSGDLIEKGWIRIGDSHRNNWEISVMSLDNIPSYVDNLLAQFVPSGSRIGIDDAQNNYQQFEWPVKSVQQAVNQAQRQPVMSSFKSFMHKQAVLNKLAERRELNLGIMPDTNFTVLINPSKSEIVGLFNRAKPHEVRWVLDSDGTLYAWNAYEGEHLHVIDALEEAGYPVSYDDVESTPHFGMANNAEKLFADLKEWGQKVYANLKAAHCGPCSVLKIEVLHILIDLYYKDNNIFPEEVIEELSVAATELKIDNFNDILESVVTEYLEEASEEIGDKLPKLKNLLIALKDIAPKLGKEIEVVDKQENVEKEADLKEYSNQLTKDINEQIIKTPELMRLIISTSKASNSVEELEEYLKNTFSLQPITRALQEKYNEPVLWNELAYAWFHTVKREPRKKTVNVNIENLPVLDKSKKLDELLEQLSAEIDPRKQEQIKQHIERIKNASLKEASSNIFEVNGVKVYKNPLPEQAMQLYNKSEEPSLRYYISPEGDIYMWDAWHAEHDTIVNGLGYEFDPDLPAFGMVFSGQDAYNAAKDYKEHAYSLVASLIIQANPPSRFWIAPDGKEFPVASAGHGAWIKLNKDILKQYGLSFTHRDLIWRKMIDSGWIRVSDEPHGTGFTIEVNNFANIPPYLDDFIAKYFSEGDTIVIGMNDNFVRITDPFPSIQKAVNKELRNPTNASLKKEARENAAWIDPQGKVYQLKGELHGGGYATHGDWVENNQKFLKKQYGINIPINLLKDQIGDYYSELVNPLIEQGWSRIGDIWSGSGYGVEVKDIHKIHPAVFDYILTHEVNPDAEITFEEQGGPYVTILGDDLVGKGQKAINRALHQPVHANLKQASILDEVLDQTTQDAIAAEYGPQMLIALRFYNDGVRYGQNPQRSMEYAISETKKMGKPLEQRKFLEVLQTYFQ